MSLLIDDLKKGWQNKARHQLMHTDAVYVANDVDFSETGGFRARKSFAIGTGFPYYPIIDYTLVNNLYKVYVEGVNKYLFYFVAAGYGLCRFNSVTNVISIISSAITTDKFVSYAPMKPMLSSYTYVYITDGTTMLCDNGTLSRTWGIDPPTGAPTVAISSVTGSLSTGDYSYVYTFYDSNTGAESDPSPACADISVTSGQAVLVSNIETSTNSRVTSRMLYRTIADGGTRYLVAIIPDNVVKEYDDTITDANLTQAVVRDQGVPPIGSIVLALKNVLFLSGDVNYHNRVYYATADYPDNFPSLNYVEAGDSGTVIQNMVNLEGKVHFITKTGVIGLTGDDPESYSTHTTKADDGTYAKKSVVVVGGGIYYLSKLGINRFDGVKSERVSNAIDRLFGDTPTSLYPIVDKSTAGEVAQATGFNGKYYIRLPLVYDDGTVANRIVEYDPTEKQWRLISTVVTNRTSTEVDKLYWLLGDNVEGKLYGVIGSYSSSVSNCEVVDLIATDTKHTGDKISPKVVTKDYDITASPGHPVKAPEISYGRTASRVDEVAWIKEYRIDALGTWSLTFYVDGVSRFTATLSNLKRSDAYVWRAFTTKIKGRFLHVKLEATNAGPISHVFNELEIR